VYNVKRNTSTGKDERNKAKQNIRLEDWKC